MELYYVTFPDTESRDRLIESALTESLAACANTFPSSSTYRWNDDIEHAEEHIVLFKTADGAGEALVEHLTQEHPYDVPAIIEITAETTEAYNAYLTDEVETPD